MGTERHLDPEQPTVRTAVFGKQVEHFLESDIGEYLIQCARQQSEEWTEKLKVINCWETEKIMGIQMKIQVAELFIGWLGDAVRAGMQATQHIQEDA